MKHPMKSPTNPATLMLRTSLLTFGLIALAACATAPKQSASTKTKTQAVAVSPEMMKEATKVAEAGDPDEEICRKVKQTTTRFTKKVCMTRKQWQDMASKATRGTAETQQRSFDPGRGN